MAGIVRTFVKQRLFAVGIIAFALVLIGAQLPAPPVTANPAPTPHINHVFVINLENESFSASFSPGCGPSQTYLSCTLPSKGQLLTQYYAVGHVSLDNYIAEVSGQAPIPDTQGDCQVYADAQPGTVQPDGQVVAPTGCVYPASVHTIADQLQSAGLSWRGYMEDMGNDPTRDNGVDCAHPVPNTQDQTQSASATDQYATRHNPFVYFHSLLDSGSCARFDVPLTQLTSDLASPQTTPNVAFITPNLCNDGHDPSLPNQTTCTGTNIDGGKAGGLVAANLWLQHYVPIILGSSGFNQGNGMLLVTFDEASTSDATACCNEQAGPSSPKPGITGPGGGRVGALVISPFTVAGTTNATPYNHYAMLRSIEDLFGLSHLGMAGAAGLIPFGPDVYNNPLG
jgi:hypothetical protein